MRVPDDDIGPFRRFLFAAVGLAAGDAALLVFLLFNAWRLGAASLKVHTGPSQLALLRAAVDIFAAYALFSILGWALVGLPIALAFPVRPLLKAPWPIRVLIGAALGPLALLLLLVVLEALQGTSGTFSLAHSGGLWPFSIVVSTAAFLVFTALLRRRSHRSSPIPQKNFTP